MINVLFVCMGNICRSPMAEAVFKHLVEQAGLEDQFEIDSVGTISYHVGEPTHPGTRRVLAQHGIPSSSVSRQVTRTDLAGADYVIAMDRDNIADLRRMMRGASLDGRVHLLLDLAGSVQERDVPDPYYSDNFEYVYRLVQAGCQGLLDHIRQEHSL